MAPLSGSRRGRRMYRCKPVLRTRGEPLVYFTRLRGWGRKLHAISAGSALKSAIRSQRRSPRAFWAGQAIYWHGVHPVGRTDLHIARVVLQLDDGERSSLPWRAARREPIRKKGWILSRNCLVRSHPGELQGMVRAASGEIFKACSVARLRSSTAAAGRTPWLIA